MFFVHHHHHHHFDFTTDCMLAWVRWSFSGGFFPGQPILCQTWLQSQLSLFIMLKMVHVLLGLPFPLTDNLNKPTLTGFSLSSLSPCPNHLSFVWHKTSVILAIPNLFCNSKTDMAHRSYHLHVSSNNSVITLSFSDQVSLPYSMTIVTQAEYNFLLVLCKNTWDVKRGRKSSLSFF